MLYDSIAQLQSPALHTLQTAERCGLCQHKMTFTDLQISTLNGESVLSHRRRGTSLK